MINYEGKRFRKVVDGTGAEVPAAVYRHEGDLVWAEFAGGEVRRGSLAGVTDTDGVISFAYSMVLNDGRIVSGHSVNTPQLLDDGRIRFHEQWERYGANADSGVSYLEEVR
ncbi:hypothetical protein [Streptomyces sp. NPDC059957]|uniref:hypothetical protein n=1 Tax=Streptomyces sp. NPDC059957 TaxID=3347016 RepID=UPI003648066C